MKIAILGYDRQGKSAYEYWRGDNDITICDAKTDLDLPEDAVAKLGKDYLDKLSEFDLLVRTPGLHPRQIVEANPDTPDILDKVTTITNEFLRICPTKNIIGVTGTKGKGTTSTLLTEMLACAGKRVHLGGNIGIPPLDLLSGKGLRAKDDTSTEAADKKTPGALHGDAPQGTDETRTESYSEYEEGELESVTQKSAPSASGISSFAREQVSTMQSIQKDDWVVLELANYQLIDLQYAPHIGVCLMVVPEHLDWHTDLDEYLRAKQQLFTHQTESDVAIYKAGDNRSTHIATTSLGNHIPYMESPGAIVKDDYIEIDTQKIIKTTEVPLLGDHNLENVCAATTAVWQITQNATAVKAGIEQVASLPHRLELIADVRGVTFYNDSIGTTPETAIAAIRAMKQPTILLLGGSDKGIEFDELAKEISKSPTVKEVVLMGKTGPAIQVALEKVDYDKISYGGSTMIEVVKTAYEHTESGDAVLLSPACASFDMFVDYVDRGEQFNQAVSALD